MEKIFKQKMECSKFLLGGQKVNVSDLKMAKLSTIQQVIIQKRSSKHTNIKT